MSRQKKTVEAVALLIDVGQHVNRQDQNGNSFLSLSKKCASRIVQRKLFSTAFDQFSLILIGSEKTDNELSYSHIQVINKYLTAPNWNMVKDIENISATSVTNGDWLDGLVVAINVLKSESECKSFSDLKIVLLSNLGGPVNSKDQVDTIINTMKDLNIKLVVIGPQCDSENENSEDLPDKTNTQRKGEALMSRIVDEVEGVICGFDVALEQLKHSQKTTARAAPWNCDLQIGKDIFIPVTAFKKVSEKKLFSFKKRSVEKREIVQEIVYFDGDNQVDKADVINSYLFGQTVIPIAGDDKASMALVTEKCCQVIGFTKKVNVPRYMLLGDSVYYVTAKSNDQAATAAVTALVKALLELEMVAIVRRVYMKNTAPRIGALMPTCEQGSYFFYYAQLPFAEDERLTRLPSLKKVQPSQAQLDAVDQLIDAMDLSELDEDEDPYRKLVNPTVEHKYNLISQKAMQPDSLLPSEPSDDIKSLLQPLPDFLENAVPALNLIKELFPLEEIEQKSYRKGAAELFNKKPTTNGDSSNAMQVDVKVENFADSMASLVQSAVTEVGTIDPEGNFLQLLKQGESFNKLCEQMQTAIKKLLVFSNSVGFQKPMSALSLLRTHCVEKNPIAYNNFIASLKDDLGEMNSNEIWSQVVQENLGLITSLETDKSFVTPEEATIFYEVKKSEPQSENYEMEDEEMLDLL